MIEINEVQFYGLLKSTTGQDHINLLINIKNAISIDIRKITSFNKFENCNFIGKTINFNNPSIQNNEELSGLYFVDCEFETNEFIISDCKINKLTLNKCKIRNGKFRLSSAKVENITFDDLFCPNGEIIFNKIISNYLDIASIVTIDYLLIHNCIIQNCKIHKSMLNRLDVTNCEFPIRFQFSMNALKEDSFIKHNTFQKSNFHKSHFGTSIYFDNNDFLSTTLFQEVGNLKSTVVFKSCKFEKYTYFNNSKLDDLKIDASKFMDFISFQETEFNTIFIDRTLFTTPAFFDEIKINNPEKCNKRTFRIIKQQLSGTHNQIDFNVFKSYELNAYRLELIKQNRKWYNNKDAFILSIGTLFSDNGLNWIKALFVTLTGSLIFYSIFYWFQINHCELTMINLDYLEHYFNGFLKYILPTNIYNPFKNREYVIGLAWFPFMFGKFFLAIGIYEIIKSFRKYKK